MKYYIEFFKGEPKNVDQGMRDFIVRQTQDDKVKFITLGQETIATGNIARITPITEDFIPDARTLIAEKSEGTPLTAEKLKEYTERFKAQLPKNTD